MSSAVFWLGILVFGLPDGLEERIVFTGMLPTQSACIEEIQNKAMPWFHLHLEPLGVVAKMAYCAAITPSMIVPLVENGGT